MDVKEYQSLRAKAKPVVAKLRSDKNYHPTKDELAVVAAAAKAKTDVWAVKPPLCYIASMDVRKYLPPEVSYSSEYKRKLRFRVRLLVKKIILGDVEFAQKQGVTTLEFGVATKAARKGASAGRKAELEAKRAVRRKERDKKKAIRTKENEARQERVAKRKVKAADKIRERAKKLGLKVQ